LNEFVGGSGHIVDDEIGRVDCWKEGKRREIGSDFTHNVSAKRVKRGNTLGNEDKGYGWSSHFIYKALGCGRNG
jgi:hypothetical protein